MGVADKPIYQTKCLPSPDTEKGRNQLRFEIDGREFAVKLKISNLSKALVSNLPERSLDLLELAALVYGVDSAKSRGGSADAQMGKKWHRHFRIEMPVCDLAFWTSKGVQQEFEEMLMFLSGDRFAFQFIQKLNPTDDPTTFFDFTADNGWRPDRVLMFSGGLDSFSGAVEEIAEQKQKLALVSHFSSTKIKPVQVALKDALNNKFGKHSCRHVPINVQMSKGSNNEGTHRARSFLFAVLGSVVAQVFDQGRVSFYENGVVSLNLPPVGNVLGTRATRTTHPQTLTRFSGFLGKVFDRGMRVDNPYFWRTKREVVETIARLGMGDQIAHTRSCADVHSQITQYPHCGRCSQCIDRRFAILAAGLGRHDPEEAYRVDLLNGERQNLIDREVALSYVRNGFAYEHMAPNDLRTLFPAVMDAVTHLGQPEEMALKMITNLLFRHSETITKVMRPAIQTKPAHEYAEVSLPRLYGDVQREVILPSIGVVASKPEQPQPHKVVINEAQNAITFDDAVEFRNNATAELLITLAMKWLEGAGAGLDPLDYPLSAAGQLAKQLGLDSEENLRKRIIRSRKTIKKQFKSAGLDLDVAENIIENIPWKGYRLGPELVTVRILN